MRAHIHTKFSAIWCKQHAQLSLSILFLVLTQHATEANPWHVHGLQASPFPTTLRLEASRGICEATLINGYPEVNDTRALWITAAECCTDQNLVLNDRYNQQSIIFKPQKVADERWCIGESSPHTGRRAVRFNGLFLPAQSKLTLHLSPHKNQSWITDVPIDFTSTFFSLNPVGYPQRTRLGMPLMWEDQLVGVMSQSRLSLTLFTPVHELALQACDTMPDEISFSCADGFKGNLTRYRIDNKVEYVEEYAFTASDGSTVKMSQYVRYPNGSYTAVHRSETKANGVHIEYDTFRQERGAYLAARLEQFNKETPHNITRYMDWAYIDGKESFRFQHKEATLTLHNSFGKCNAFKIDDSQVFYPGHDYWVTAAHCSKGNLTISSDVHQTSHPVALFSKNYFDADWAILLGSETDGPGLQINFGSHTIYSPVTHLQANTDPITHTLEKNGLDLSQPLFGIGHLFAKPGGSGSPIIVSDHVIGIQSSTFFDSAMIVSHVPPREAFRKTMQMMWHNKDLPINKLIFFDTDAVINSTGFSIRDNTEYTELSVFTTENNVIYSSLKLIKTENGTRSAADFSISDPYIRNIKWQKRKDDIRVKRQIKQFVDHSVTCYALVETSKETTCRRLITKFNDNRTLDVWGYHHDLVTGTTTSNFHEEIDPTGAFSYFKNVQQFVNGSITFEHSNGAEFVKGKTQGK